MGVPNDPLFAQQWHLLNTGQTGGVPGIDIDVVPVWDDYTGEGVRVAVVDSGIDETHPDLVANYDAAASYNYFLAQPGGAATGAHGTACAGLIAAEANNGIGGSGVAPGVSFASFPHGTTLYKWTEAHSNTLREPGLTDVVSLQMEVLSGIRNFDISSHSYTFLNSITEELKLIPAITALTEEGRGGLGQLVFWAANNDRGFGEDNFGLPHLNVRGVMTVAAIDADGTYRDSSNPGAGVFICAPGTQTVTTDIQGSAGYASGDYDLAFSGTSAATPIAAGVGALILDANPGLGWRDVQDIIALTARQVDAGNAGWVINHGQGANGGGLHWSRDYGFGLIDARAAVRLAEIWTEPARTSANDASLAGTHAQTASITQGTLTQTLTLSGSLDLQQMQLYLDLDHQNLGDLIITLTSPSGTTVTLLNRYLVTVDDPRGAGQTTLTLDRPFLFNGFWGENAAGTWTLTITDVTAANNGTLRSWRLEAWGDTPGIDDRYIFTDEFARLALDDPSRTLLADAGGLDTLNAAAVTGNSVINLNAGNTSTIAGTALQIAAGTTIENAYGGDGNDRATGNAAANLLSGGRGNDTVSGNGGNDRLFGDQGDDSLNGGAGADTLSGGPGADMLDGGGGTDTVDYSFAAAGGMIALGAGTATIDGVAETFLNIENAMGSQGADTISGSAIANRLDGAGGNDSVAGGDGNDTLVGGIGNDTLAGEAGNDSLLGSDGDDLLRGGGGTDTFNGGAGSDTIDYSYATVGGSITLGTTGSAVINGEAESFAAIENAIGSQGADTITGSTAANRLDGLDGSDSISAGAGNDTVSGGTGLDTMDGGSGLDTIDYAFSLTGGRITLGTSSGNATIGGVAETFTGFENAIGSRGNDTITGSSGANRLDGFDGNDSLAGGAGNDTLAGGAGVDTMDGGNGNDTVDYSFSAVGGSIVIGAGSGSATIGGVAETFLNIENAIGSQGDDTLTGSGAGERLDGAGGNDSIAGGLGSDTLLGGDGNDTLTAAGGGSLDGGAGDDLLILTDYIANALLGGAGIDTLRMTTDTLYAFDPGNGIEVVDRLGGTLYGSGGDDVLDFSAARFAGVVYVNASSGNDLLIGTAGADYLTGSYGNDTVIGGAGPDVIGGDGWGDDSLVGGEDADHLFAWGHDTLDGGASGDLFYMEDVNACSVIGGDGLDLISYRYRSGGGTIDLAAGAATIDGVVDVFSSIEQAVGSQGNDTILGSAEDNWIWGVGGNDSIDGAAGNDNIDGGDGADTLNGGVGSDTVQYYQLSGGGTITLNGATGSAVIGGVTDTLFNFENAVGSTGNDTISGYAAANRLEGWTGNDSLSGLGGNDTLLGGDGDDTIVGGTGSDLMSGGAGADLFRYTATAFNVGDVAAGVVDTIWGTAGDRIDFAAGIEGLLKVGGVALSAATSDIDLVIRVPLAAGTTNLSLGLVSRLQFDLNNDGVYDPGQDFAIDLHGNLSNITYIAAGDYFLLQ